MRIAICVAEDFNLGAAYVISYLKSIGHEVRLFLDWRKDYGNIRDIQAFSPSIVGISCVTANFRWASDLGAKIREKVHPDRIIIGGVHPTLCPDDIIKEGFEVCVGDGIKYFGGEFDPDKLWPDREAFFEQMPPVHRAYQIFMTGFGCPFRCSFCNNHQLRPKLIRRSEQGCINELAYLKKRGLRYVLFDDDIFTLNRNWLSNFLEGYRNSVNLLFTCFGHAKFIDNEIALLLQKSNCRCVWLGLQSGNEDVRKEILNRKETNEEVMSACRIIKDNKLKLMIDHIFGLPFDNRKKIEDSYELYKRLKPDVVNCYELLYFPKAEINKFGTPRDQALYQKQGGQDFKRYAKAFTSIPLLVC